MHELAEPLKEDMELKEFDGGETDEKIRLKPVMDMLLQQVNDQTVSIYSVYAFSQGPWYSWENIALLYKAFVTFVIQIVISSMIIYHTLNKRRKEHKDFCPMRNYEEFFTAKFTGFCVCVYLYALTEKHTSSTIPDHWTSILYKKSLAFVSYSGSDSSGPLLSQYLHYPSCAQYELMINQLCLWISTVAGYLAIYFLTSSPFDIILNSLAMTFLFEMDEMITTPKEIHRMHKTIKRMMEDLQNNFEEYDEIEIQSVQPSCLIWMYWWFQWLVWNFILRPIFFLTPIMFVVCY